MERSKDKKNFEIIKDFGVLEKSNGDWVKKLVYIQWYDHAPAFEIRSFNKDVVGKLSKLSEEGMRKLKEIIS